MIENTIIALWTVFVIGIGGLVLISSIGGKKDFPFLNYGKVDIPYISLDIQGHPLNMIVDSGAGMSIISSDALLVLTYEECLRNVELSCITDEKIPNKVVRVPISVCGKEIQEDFVVHPTKDIANFESYYGISIHGILGNEFFERTGCKIDYQGHCVTLH